MEYTQRRDRIAGIAVVLLGIVVAIVAVIAIKNPGTSQGDTTPAAQVRNHQSQHPAARHSTSMHPAKSAGAASSSPAGAPSQSSSSGAAGSTPGAPTAADKKIPLVVMNNTTTTGLAAGAEARFQQAGWTVTSVGTMSNTIISTCAYYDPTVPGAQHAAEALKAEFPTIKRVEPRFSQLASGPVVVVLAWDYQPA